jgi:arylsulfatase A-like enzyme
LAPVLAGEALEGVRDLYFVRREGGAAYGGKSYEALIRGDWKLLQNDPYSPRELYHLRDDPRETINLAEQRPEVVRELSAALAAQIQRGGSTPWQAP